MGIFDFFRSKRGEDIQQIAGQLSCDYRSKDDFGLIKLLADFKLFNSGGRRSIRNILSHDVPSLDCKIWIFDYHYTISTGHSSHTVKQSVFFIQSKELGLPHFHLRPEHFLDKIGSWFGMEDIDFDEYSNFSKAYHLKGADEYMIRKTFSDRVIDYFTSEPGWHVEGLNYYLVIYRAKKLLHPTQLAAFEGKGHEVFQIFKGEGFSV
ncbi:MAG: hypothetical protein IPL46_12695 [Saprospiraceae bacterium]|nr:hypothetical protein [Saprospiraceae bacterium]